MKKKLNKIQFSISIEIENYGDVVAHAPILKKLLLEPSMEKCDELCIARNINFREVELDLNSERCPFYYAGDGIEIFSRFDRDTMRVLIFDVVVFQLVDDLEPVVGDDNVIQFK